MVVFDHAGFALSQADTQVGGLEGVLRRMVFGSTRFALGPSIFFVISGYCVATSVASARRNGTSPLAFMGRRFWRIVPTYWVALMGFVLITATLDLARSATLYEGANGLALASPSSLTPSQWIGNITLTEIWRPFYLPGAESAVYTRVAWTLCYQEQFYVVSSIVWALCAGRWFTGLGVVTIVSGAILLFYGDIGALRRIDGLFFNYWHEFAVGLAVYWRLQPRCTRRAKRAIEIGLLGLAGIAFGLDAPSSGVAALFGLVLIGTQGWSARIEAVRLLDPVRACGRRCYSIYLVHLPICAIGGRILIQMGLEGFWARALIVVPTVSVVAVALSWAFYAAIESKFTGTPKLPQFSGRLQGLLNRAHRPSPIGAMANA